MTSFFKFARALPICVLLAGCATTTDTPPAPPAPSQTPAVAQFPPDDLGRPVGLKAPAQRVVAISPGAVETIFALGAGGQLVGRDDYATVPNAARKVAVAGNYQGPNVEAAIALRPDLVLVQGETYDATRAADWQAKIGVPVAVLTPRTLKEVRAGIEKMGAWLGKKPQAQKLAATLTAPAAPQNGPQAFVQIGSAPLYTAGRDTLVGNVIEAAGFRNAAPIKGYQPYNVESLLANPPQFYIVPSDKSKAQVVAELQKSPVSKLQCVQKGRVIVVNSDLVLRPGPRLKQGIAQLRREREAQQP